ncbi:MAG TPA: hypothetical protein VJK07_03810 [Candidatus Nanoarchaeia archaeon]|nr:hypothetical protein [Candidatus Nanoarchaeia archaeon]
MGHRLIRRCGIACMGLGALVGGPAITTLVSGVLHEISTPAEKQIPSWVYHTRDSARIATFAAAGMLVAGRLLYGLSRQRVYNTA